MCSGDEDSAVRSQRDTSTSYPQKRLSWLNGCSTIVAKRVVHAAITIEAENRQLKISRSRRENFPVGLNGDGKCRSGISAPDHNLAADAEIRIERTISFVTQEAGLFRILISCNKPSYHDLAITLESPGIRACVCRSDHAAPAKLRVQSARLRHQRGR